MSVGRKIRALLGAVLLVFVGGVLGVFVERWHADTLSRSDVVCAASRSELSALEQNLTGNDALAISPAFMRFIEQAQANIARNCGWLPFSVVLPTPRPTDEPKPATPPR